MALKELRQASKTWVASIFVGLLVVSFSIWGVNDVFRGGASRGVAKVGNQWISASEYQRRFRQTLDQYARQANKQLTSEDIAALRLKEQVLDQLVDLTALNIKADRLGLAVHDDSLKRVIRTMATFQGIDGKFDSLTYQSKLANAGYTPASFESELRQDISLAQLRGAIEAGAHMPRGLIEDLITYRGEMRQVSYVVLDPSVAGDIPAPDDATLKAYVAAHAEKFTRPELRSFIAVLFRPQDFVAQVQVPEDEIKASYDFDIDKYKVAETRSVRAIAFADEASARAAYNAIKDGKKSFEQAGKERGYADADLAFKDQAKTGMSDPKVAEAAFAAPGPALIEPVNGSLAWTIAEVKAITPGSTKPIEQVRDEIRDKVALNHAQDMIDKVVNQFEDGRAGGETDEELAKRLNLKLIKFEGVDAKGMDGDGKPVLPTPETPQLVAAAFAADEGTENDPDFLKEGWDFVVRVDQIQPPALKPIDKIAAEARADYVKDEQHKRLVAKAAALVGKYKAQGVGPAATEVGKAPTTLAAPLQRGQPSDVLSDELVGTLFTASQGELVSGPAAKGDAVILANVMAIAAPNAQDRAGGVTTLSARLDEALGGDLTTQFVIDARRDLGVRIDAKTLDTAASSAR